PKHLRVGVYLQAMVPHQVNDRVVEVSRNGECHTREADWMKCWGPPIPYVAPRSTHGFDLNPKPDRTSTSTSFPYRWKVRFWAVTTAVTASPQTRMVNRQTTSGKASVS